MPYGYSIFLCLIINLIIVNYGLTNSDEINDTRNSFSNRRPINLLITNDDDNDVANKSVRLALETIRNKHPDWLGEIYVIKINETDPNESLDRICSIWDESLQNNRIPDLILDTTKSGLGAEVVNSFTSALGLPTLSAQFGQENDLRYWRDLDEKKKNYLIQIMPPADLVPELIRQLSLNLSISNAAILYDDNFIMDHKYKSLLLNVPTRHVINNAARTIPEARVQLSRLRDLDIVNFFLLGDKETFTIILDAAQLLNFTGRKYGWFGITLDEFTPQCNCQKLSLLFSKPINIMSAEEDRKNLNPNNEFKIIDDKGSSIVVLPKPTVSSAFYFDLTRIGIQAMKSAIDANEWNSNTTQITCNDYVGNNTPVRDFDFFNRLKQASESIVPLFSKFEWGHKNGQHGASFNLSISLVEIVTGKPTTTVDVGEWTSGIDRHLHVTNKDGIMNHTAITSYRVVTVIHPPFVMYDEATNTWSGYCIDLLNEINSTVKFEYEIRQVDDKQYGEMNENGTWNGMIKELMDKRADIALGSLWVMAERENVVDFTVPYYDLVGLNILMLKTTTPTSLFKFLTVLENEVWFCILAAYFFTSFLMWVFDRWSPYSYQNNREKYKDDDEKREFGLRECLWFCMTSLTPQGGGEAPKNLSGRLVAATWWLFGFIIIASYTANLAAFLTVSRLDTPIESLDDLSKQYKIQYAPVKDSPAYTYFERMANIEMRFYEIWKDMSLNDSLTDVQRAKLAVWDYPVSDKFTKMFQAMKEAGFPRTIDEAVRRVRRLDSANEFAFIGDASTIKYLVMTNCDLVSVGEEFSRKPYAVAVQQGSPLRDQFNNAILVLLNKRKLEKLKDKWWKSNPSRRNCDKEGDESDGISIDNIGGVFIVIFVGIGMACCTLAFEYWWYRYRPRPEGFNTNSSPKNKRDPKPMRFNLHPAPTHGFEATKF